MTHAKWILIYVLLSRSAIQRITDVNGKSFSERSFTVDNIEICTGQFASKSNLHVECTSLVFTEMFMGNDNKEIYSVIIAGCFLQGTSKNLK